MSEFEPSPDTAQAIGKILTDLAHGRTTKIQAARAMLPILKKDPASAELVDDDTGYLEKLLDRYTFPGNDAEPGLLRPYLLGEHDHDEFEGLSPADELMICDICREPLQRLAAADGQTWVHDRSWARYDHEVSPRSVPLDEPTNRTCDFCGQQREPHWAFVGQRLRSETQFQNQVNDYGTTWTACQDCAPLILNSDTEALMERVLRVSRMDAGLPSLERATMRRELMNLWTTFLPTVHEKRYVGPRREPARLDPRMMPKLQRGLAKFWSHPNLLNTVVKNRHGSVQTFPGVHCGDEDSFVRQFPPGREVPQSVVDNHARHLVAGIWASDLYWISANFTQLAIMAGKDLDKIVISREELPSTFGFMVFERPIGEIKRPHGTAAIRGVSWTLIPRGIWLNLYIQGEDGDPEVDVEEMRSELGYLMCPNHGSAIRFDEEIPLPEPGEFDFILTILATWFLMRQPGVADTSSAPVDKKLARSYQRQHQRRLPDVQLVDLRRRPHRPGTDVETREGRKLSVRVYRRGHWKRQAYGPKWGLRKTIYVSAYIAGPEDAPLKEFIPTVKVLR